MPELIEFTDEQFKDLLETLLTSGFAQKRVAEIMSPGKPAASAVPAKSVSVISDDNAYEDEDESDITNSPYI
jgi:hypothetical protein